MPRKLHYSSMQHWTRKKMSLLATRPHLAHPKNSTDRSRETTNYKAVNLARSSTEATNPQECGAYVLVGR